MLFGIFFVFIYLSFVDRDDNISLAVINPRREKSGTYTVILRKLKTYKYKKAHISSKCIYEIFYVLYKGNYIYIIHKIL